MIPALIAGAASIMGAGMGAASQSRTNNANLRINQMNNEFNARQAQLAFERETAYNDKIRSEDRVWNSAQAQVQRWRDAGLNPSIMMQGQGAGTAQSSSVGSPNAQASTAAAMQAYRPDFSGIENAAMQFADLQFKRERQNEELKGLRIENQYKTAQILAELEYMKQKTDDSRYSALLKKSLNSYQDQIQMDAHNESMARTYSMISQAEMFQAESLLMSKELDTFDERHRREMALKLSEINLNDAKTNLTKQQKRTEVYNTLLAQYESQGRKDAVRMAQLQTPKILEKMDADLAYVKKLTKYHGADKTSDIFGNVMNGMFQTALMYGILKGFKPMRKIGFK